ncbi:hypothetical protein BG015_003846, partial [Linnemannia schmuckeri]
MIFAIILFLDLTDLVTAAPVPTSSVTGPGPANIKNPALATRADNICTDQACAEACRRFTGKETAKG